MTTQRFPAFPPGNPFPESNRDTVGDGAPDFPTSAGTREQGKFRPSVTPKLTQIAIANDDGTQIGSAWVVTSEEQTALLRGILFALSILVDQSAEDLLTAANSD